MVPLSLRRRVSGVPSGEVSSVEDGVWVTSSSYPAGSRCPGARHNCPATVTHAKTTPEALMRSPLASEPRIAPVMLLNAASVRLPVWQFWSKPAKRPARPFGVVDRRNSRTSPRRQSIRPPTINVRSGPVANYGSANGRPSYAVISAPAVTWRDAGHSCRVSSCAAAGSRQPGDQPALGRSV